MPRGEKVQVRVSPELLKQIDAACKKTHLTRSALGQWAFELIVVQVATYGGKVRK